MGNHTGPGGYQAIAKWMQNVKHAPIGCPKPQKSNRVSIYTHHYKVGLRKICPGGSIPAGANFLYGFAGSVATGIAALSAGAASRWDRVMA